MQAKSFLCVSCDQHIRVYGIDSNYASTLFLISLNICRRNRAQSLDYSETPFKIVYDDFNKPKLVEDGTAVVADIINTNNGKLLDFKFQVLKVSFAFFF